METLGVPRFRRRRGAHDNGGGPCRVLFLVDGLDNGGLERQVTLLVRNLPAKYDGVVCSPRNGPYADVFRNAGVDLRLTPRRATYDPSAMLRLWRLVWEWRPDVVHTWGWRCSLEVAPLCAMLGIPLLHGAIRSGIVTHGPLWLPRYSVWAADRVVANSRAGLAAWRIPPALGTVVYNGFDATRVAAHARVDEDGSPAGPLRVVMTGSMGGKKDYGSVISAARELTASGDKGWAFALIGDGAYREQLKSTVARCALADVVAFPEPDLEVMGEVCTADIGVLMTDPLVHAEGCPNSIMEYMAAGLPVVCSDSGGTRELVVDGVTGFIVRPRDVGALVERLRFLRDSPDERRRMGEAGRQRVLGRFSVEKMVSAYVRLYQSACGLAEAGTR